MAKEINEKTFELNITNELLNLSKSLIWYLEHFHWFHFPNMLNGEVISQFMNQATFFAEGLTQEEESNPLTGGYDVAINYNHPNGQEGRLMFLQFKSGVRKNYSNISSSKFNRRTAREENRRAEHIMFTFNDAANCTQHSALRNLANRIGIQPESVIYVFPRITEKKEFNNKVGNLITSSSFVPVLEIDKQALNQAPAITIIDGESHKYRTSYDGLTSEVNFFFFFFFYDNKIITELLSELICIQVERFAKILIEKNSFALDLFLDVASNGLNQFVEYELVLFASKELVNKNLESYFLSIREVYIKNKTIPQAPSRYTTIIPKDGLRLNLEHKNDFSRINYQIF